MSFNRRGPDRRPDRDRPDRSDRPPQRRGDWQPRERAGGDRQDRPYQPRGGSDRPYQPRGGGDRPYQPRGGGDRPYTPRPRFEGAQDEGAMSLRLDPRRVNALKHLAGEAGVRPGDLVRQWVEERIDASRTGADASPAPDVSLMARLEELTARVAALEMGSSRESAPSESVLAPSDETADAPPAKPRGRPRKSASARPSEPRVGLHDEMIAVIAERGPLSAAELAQAITERGHYVPPRSGKPLDAAMVSQRVSNPTYRSRFKRSEGRIGLAEGASEGA